MTGSIVAGGRKGVVLLVLNFTDLDVYLSQILLPVSICRGRLSNEAYNILSSFIRCCRSTVSGKSARAQRSSLLKTPTYTFRSHKNTHTAVLLDEHARLRSAQLGSAPPVGKYLPIVNFGTRVSNRLLRFFGLTRKRISVLKWSI